MAAFYHVISNPMGSTAFDADADVDAAEDDGSGTPTQILRRARFRKFRRRLMGWFAAQAMDWRNCAVMSIDNTLVHFETTVALPGSITPGIDALFVQKNLTRVQMRAYLAPSRANWA